MKRAHRPTDHLATLAMAGIGGLVATAGGWGPLAAGLIGGANGLAFAVFGPFLPRRASVTLGVALPLAACLLPSGQTASSMGHYAVLLAMVPVALLGARRAEAIAAEQAAAEPSRQGTWMKTVIEGDGPRPTAGKGEPRPMPPRRDPDRRRLSRRTERRPVMASSR